MIAATYFVQLFCLLSIVGADTSLIFQVKDKAAWKTFQQNQALRRQCEAERQRYFYPTSCMDLLKLGKEEVRLKDFAAEEFERCQLKVKGETDSKMLTYWLSHLQNQALSHSCEQIIQERLKDIEYQKQWHAF